MTRLGSYSSLLCCHCVAACIAAYRKAANQAANNGRERKDLYTGKCCAAGVLSWLVGFGVGLRLTLADAIVLGGVHTPAPLDSNTQTLCGQVLLKQSLKVSLSVIVAQLWWQCRPLPGGVSACKP